MIIYLVSLLFSRKSVDLEEKKLTVNSSVCPVCSPSELRGQVDLDMLNHQSVGVQHLYLSIALSIFEQLKKNLCTLPRPATLGSC